MKKKKNRFVSVLAFALVTPVAVAAFAEAAPTEASKGYVNPFKDIKSSHDYYDILHQMRDKGIITGYDDNTFRPDVKISRQHAAVLIKRTKVFNTVVPLKAYKDVPSNHPYYDAIMEMQQTGLIEADSNGNFNPSKDLTRGEMALLLANVFNLSAKDKHPFTDVSNSSKMGQAIAALYEAEITTGYNESEFRPNEPLSRAHYAVFLYRALNYQEKIEEQKPKPNENKPSITNVNTPLDEFNMLIKNDPVYALKKDSYYAIERTYANEKFRKIITEGRDVVDNSGLHYSTVSGLVVLESKDSNNQVIVNINKDNELSFYIDFKSPNSVDATRELIKLAYPEIDIDSLISERAQQAKEAYEKEGHLAPENREFQGNSTIENINGYNVKIGANAFLDNFWIEIDK